MPSTSPAGLGPKQIATNNAFYVNVADIRTHVKINIGTDSAPQLSTATWANNNSPGVSTVLASPGAVLRDMGKNLISSGRIFRKIQYLASNNLATSGVIDNGYGAPQDYYQGYIELPGLQGNTTGGVPAPVARLG
jgi:hypothetical protein